jgi:vacuolar-type H+-ATPase subunit H
MGDIEMADTTPPITDTITGAQLSAVTFSPAKGLARNGYEPRDVDTFLRRTADAVDRLNDRLTATQQQLQNAALEIQRLRDRIDRDSQTQHVQQAISVLTTAQITADSTVAQADQYSARVMEQARDVYEDARHNAATLEQETEDKARAVYQDALRRVADLEHDNEERLTQLTLAATIAEQELDSQTIYLRTLRDATRVQIETFLHGLLDHLAEEYGQAHPMAARAATGRATATNGSAATDTTTTQTVNAR